MNEIRYYFVNYDEEYDKTTVKIKYDYLNLVFKRQILYSITYRLASIRGNIEKTKYFVVGDFDR